MCIRDRDSVVDPYVGVQFSHSLPRHFSKTSATHVIVDPTHFGGMVHLPLRDRVALITGGSRGIGRGIAEGLGREGVRVAISYRSNKSAAQSTLKVLQSAGAECFAVEADSTDPQKVNSMVEKVTERFGRLDILINNVGEFNWKPVLESSVEEWHEIVASNLYSCLLYTSKKAPISMRALWSSKWPSCSS